MIQYQGSRRFQSASEKMHWRCSWEECQTARPTAVVPGMRIDEDDETDEDSLLATPSRSFHRDVN